MAHRNVVDATKTYVVFNMKKILPQGVFFVYNDICYLLVSAILLYMVGKISFEENSITKLRHKEVVQKNSLIESLIFSTGLIQTKKGVRRLFVIIFFSILAALSSLYTSDVDGSAYGNFDTFVQMSADK